MEYRLKGGAIALVFLGLGAAPAAALGNSKTYEKTTLSGKEIFIYGGSTLNPDCSRAGKDDVRAVSGPSHGKVSIVDAKTYAHYAKGDARAKCNSRKVDGIKVLYRSKPGFKGQDQVVLSVHTYFGEAYRAVININVE